MIQSYSQLLSICSFGILNQKNRTKTSSAQILQDAVSLSDQTTASGGQRLAGCHLLEPRHPVSSPVE